MSFDFQQRSKGNSVEKGESSKQMVLDQLGGFMQKNKNKKTQLWVIPLNIYKY